MNGRCRDCQFWSEMIARAVGGPVEAMCLAPATPRYGKYTRGGEGCSSFLAGRDEFLAIDDPAREGNG
jgi:hypothetical protein